MPGPQPVALGGDCDSALLLDDSPEVPMAPVDAALRAAGARGWLSGLQLRSLYCEPDAKLLGVC